jgi:hypothetical protein
MFYLIDHHPCIHLTKIKLLIRRKQFFESKISDIKMINYMQFISLNKTKASD